MSHAIALDWDTHELRAVIANSASQKVSVTEAISVPITDDSAETVTAAIRKILDDHGLSRGKVKAMVTIGRGKSELRQLSLPPVPENELPDMVRLQAMQTFAAVGENTIVDFLPLPSAEDTTSVLAAAVAPPTMKMVTSIIESAGLELSRVALRPVAAAALYQITAGKTQNLDDSSIVGDVVLVDLLADDAEIVVMRGRRVMFVRSVRMPQESSDRPAQIAGELRRSLMACGINASSSSQKVVIWGQAKTHDAERVKMSESLGCRVSTLDPLTLVDRGSGKRGTSGNSADQTHTGRFAPLVGLLVADAAAHPVHGSPYLVDFLNPRKSIEIKTDNRKAIFIGAAVAATALLAAYGAWSGLSSRDAKIRALEADLAMLKPKVKAAEEMISRTDLIDRFLDGNVVWIDELARSAKQIPPAENAILKSVSAVSLPREGGGKLTFIGAATTPLVADELATALRDGAHSVEGVGTSDLGDKETYRWGFRETVTISPETIREKRYAMFAALREKENAGAAAPTPASETSADVPEAVEAEATSPGAMEANEKASEPMAEATADKAPGAATSEDVVPSSGDNPEAAPESAAIDATATPVPGASEPVIESASDSPVGEVK
jgi:hypothetical protein